MIRITFMLGMLNLLSLEIGLSHVAAKEQEPAYVCHAATSPVQIDGQLDEPAWKHAEVVHLRYPFRPQGAKNFPPTTARLLWDKSSIYLAWKAEDVDVWSYSNQKDDTLWKGDIVEFFVRPSNSDPTFYEINIAPNGAIYDGRYPSRGAGGYARFRKWDSNVRVATHIDGTDDNWHDTDKGYTVEAAIPLTAFAESGLPKPGTVWTFGLFRCDYSRNLDEPLLFSSLPGKLDPTYGFHSYEQYQPFVFEDQELTRKQYFPDQ